MLLHLLRSAPGRYCCKSPKLPGANFLAVKKSDRRPPIDVAPKLKCSSALDYDRYPSNCRLSHQLFAIRPDHTSGVLCILYSHTVCCHQSGCHCRGMTIPTPCTALARNWVAHIAMKRQSLPQSGMGAFVGQQGMSSGIGLLRGCLTEKSLVKIGEPSHTRTHEEICL
jgi:hypothetical protein